jgi:hypothetical protein
VVVAPPKEPVKPVAVANAADEALKTTAPVTTQSITAAAPAAVKTVAAAPAAPPVKKIAAAAPAAAAATATAAATAPAAPRKPAAVTTAAAPVASGAGYVAVLASVPVSTTSRINALKQFADMQQKYAGVLQNKTPDVKEANLGEKGTYHRLLVGPPSSRDSAQALCGSLKSAGYTSDCWVVAY